MDPEIIRLEEPNLENTKKRFVERVTVVIFFPCKISSNGFPRVNLKLIKMIAFAEDISAFDRWQAGLTLCQTDKRSLRWAPLVVNTPDDCFSGLVLDGGKFERTFIVDDEKRLHIGSTAVGGKLIMPYIMADEVKALL